jgi:Glycosyl hydrolases family 32 N-terminal domain
MKFLLVIYFIVLSASIQFYEYTGSRISYMQSFQEKDTIENALAAGELVHYFLFSYFRGEDKGMYYAISTDGYNWKELNGGKPVLTPTVDSSKLMRDPSIHLGPDGIYRVVWTTGWRGINIGYAYSKDLLHWSRQQLLPVGKKLHGTNCWAPEIFYDDVRKNYMILWSTQVGPWSSAKGIGSIYYVTTTNFKLFSDPKILLSNGFSAGGKAGDNGLIDAFIFKNKAMDYLLFYKKDDNTGVPNLFYRRGNSATGPWNQENGPIMPSTGDEGPSCVKAGNEYRVYTDPFESDSAYVFVSNDLLNWKRKVTNLKMSHGTVLEIPAGIAHSLLAN